MLEYYGFHPSIILLVPAILFTIYAQIKVSTAFARGSKIPNARGLTGFQTAKTIMNSNGMDLPISESQGKLSDHYDPIKKSLALSPQVYGQKSIAAMAVAAHEVGHALQHQAGYSFLKLRTFMYPAVSFSSKLAPFLIIAGFIFATSNLLWLGIWMYAIAVVFTVVTLPVEFDASRRAMLALNQYGLLTVDESREAKKVLSAAALTYVAAALTAILEIVRLILIARER